MRGLVAAAAILAPLGAATGVSEPPWYINTLVAIIVSGVLFRVATWRLDKRVIQTTQEKTQQERDSIAADVYDKMSRHVADDLKRMEQRVTDAQAQVAATMELAGHERLELQRQLHMLEERRHREIAEWRSRVQQLEAEIERLKAQLAQAGIHDRRQNGD